MNSRSLPTGYQIHNYRIEKFLGEGGFGITYKAVDLNLDRPVAIKEYMPLDYAVRSDSGDVEPRNAECEETYQKGLKSYVREAQALARFKHDNIVQVYTFLRHHNTAYIIMEYVDGMTFSQWLREHVAPTETELVDIMCPILMGLHKLHESDLLHRDIKPDNIYICDNNRPVLLDFGAVRNSFASGQKNAKSAIVLTEGYAPPEQYGNSGQGPWTDVYAVGACLHLAVTGKMVLDAMQRSTQVVNGNPDPQPGLVGSALLQSNYSDHFLNAIEQAIALKPKERIDGALSLKNRLLNDSATTTANYDDDPAYAPTVVRTPVDTDRLIDADLPTRVNIASSAQPQASESIESSPKSEEVRPDAAEVTSTDRSGIIKKVAGLVIGLIILAGIALKFLPIGSDIPDNELAPIKSQINEKLLIVDAMELPKTGDYLAAIANQQLATDIESKNTDGSVKDIRDNLMRADMGLNAHILSTAPPRNAELLDVANEKIEKVKLLGVKELVLPELPEFATQESDIDALRTQYDRLMDVNRQLDAGLKSNPRAYLIGSSAQDIEDALEMCGKYSDECKPEWYEDEAAREAVLSPFALGKSEVTVGEFTQYVDASNIVTKAETQGFSYTVDTGESFAVVRSEGVYWKNAYGAGTGSDKLPVVHVTRAEAMGYCASLSQRLPTEAEWEYAARGFERLIFPWGNTWDASMVGWGGDTGMVVNPVNSFQPNDRGYFDLAGSVTEWTSTDSPEENTSILKGGSRYYTNVANFRLAVRRLEFSDYTGDDVGFRCATTLDEWPVELLD